MGGSARGIGQGICINFAKTGATVAAFDFRETKETIELVKKENGGAPAKGWQVDGTDNKAVKAAIDQVEKELGSIDILVNCAGISNSRPVLMENYENFEKAMNTNCGAVSPIPTNPTLLFLSVVHKTYILDGDFNSPCPS